MQTTVIICETHNYRDVPFYTFSGDVPECMACIRDADAERDANEAYWASRSQCTMCIAGGDCYRHGFVDDYADEILTADEQLRAQMRPVIFYGNVYGGLIIDSPNYCKDVPPPF